MLHISCILGRPHSTMCTSCSTCGPALWQARELRVHRGEGRGRAPASWQRLAALPPRSRCGSTMSPPTTPLPRRGPKTLPPTQRRSQHCCSALFTLAPPCGNVIRHEAAARLRDGTALACFKDSCKPSRPALFWKYAQDELSLAIHCVVLLASVTPNPHCAVPRAAVLLLSRAVARATRQGQWSTLTGPQAFLRGTSDM